MEHQEGCSPIWGEESVSSSFTIHSHHIFTVCSGETCCLDYRKWCESILFEESKRKHAYLPLGFALAHHILFQVPPLSPHGLWLLMSCSECWLKIDGWERAWKCLWHARSWEAVMKERAPIKQPRPGRGKPKGSKPCYQSDHSTEMLLLGFSTCHRSTPRSKWHLCSVIISV